MVQHNQNMWCPKAGQRLPLLCVSLVTSKSSTIRDLQLLSCVAGPVKLFALKLSCSSAVMLLHSEPGTVPCRPFASRFSSIILLSRVNVAGIGPSRAAAHRVWCKSETGACHMPCITAAPMPQPGVWLVVGSSSAVSNVVMSQVQVCTLPCCCSPPLPMSVQPLKARLRLVRLVRLPKLSGMVPVM